MLADVLFGEVWLITGANVQPVPPSVSPALLSQTTHVATELPRQGSQTLRLLYYSGEHCHTVQTPRGLHVFDGAKWLDWGSQTSRVLNFTLIETVFLGF
jgi:hypothetical protein